ncbi:hypothetical protein QYF36_017696 [Acer negundo]|nr:hypothetical protein QYF36_017696 [Acer negundo]
MINCNSKNDDLGTHYLKYKQHFDWSFGLSIFGNTKYWCDVYWNNNGAQNFYPFDMMRINHGARGYRDYDLCEPCAWRITKDGGYRYHNKLNFEEWDKVYNCNTDHNFIICMCYTPNIGYGWRGIGSRRGVCAGARKKDSIESALARGRARFQRGDVCYTPNIGYGWWGIGSRQGVRAGARKSARGIRLPCTDWSRAGATSLMSSRQGETGQSREIDAG